MFALIYIACIQVNFLVLMQELYKDKDRYEFLHSDNLYNFAILNPKEADSGRYTLVVRIEKDVYVTSAYLEVAS